MEEERDTTRRRVLLRLGALVGAASTAGCTIEFGEYSIDIGDPDEGGTPTPTYGYGGTQTSTADGSTTSTAAGTSTRGSDASTPTSREAPTDAGTGTPPSDPADEYGLQGYGEYGYGGVAP